MIEEAKNLHVTTAEMCNAITEFQLKVAHWPMELVQIQNLYNPLPVHGFQPGEIREMQDGHRQLSETIRRLDRQIAYLSFQARELGKVLDAAQKQPNLNPDPNPTTTEA